MCDIVFEKAKGHNGIVHRTKAEEAVRRVLRNVAKFIRKHLCRSLLFDIVRRYNLQLY